MSMGDVGLPRSRLNGDLCCLQSGQLQWLLNSADVFFFYWGGGGIFGNVRIARDFPSCNKFED